jgi:CO/xanthine dehydrogenase FAD-binding subunit
MTIRSDGRSETLEARELFVPPSQNIRRMTSLEPGQILAEIAIPIVPGQRSTFLKYAVRNTWDFGLASVAISQVEDAPIVLWSSDRFLQFHGDLAAPRKRSRAAG